MEPRCAEVSLTDESGKSPHTGRTSLRLPTTLPITPTFVLLVIRSVLGFTFVFAAVSKLRQPYDFLSAIYAYKLVSADVGVLIAWLVPWIELVLGVALLGGVFISGALLISAVFFVTFLALQIYAVARGLEIDCGCFGLKQDGETLGYADAGLRVIGLLASIVGYLLWLREKPVGKTGRCSLDGPASAGKHVWDREIR